MAGVEGLFGPAGLTPPGPPFGRYPSVPNSHSRAVSNRQIAPTVTLWLGWKDYSALRASPLQGRPSGVILPFPTLALGPFRTDKSPLPHQYGWGGRIIRPCGPHPSGAALR